MTDVGDSDRHIDADSAVGSYSTGCAKNGTFSDSVAFWMNGVLSLILVIIGMIGNTAVVVSFHCCGGSKMRQRRRQAFYYYLMTFAVWNTGLLVATVLFNCIPALLLIRDGPSSSNLAHLSDVVSLIGYLCGNCCVTANVWLAVTLTAERYLAVSRPLRSRLSSPRRRAKLVCVLLSILVIVYNSPLLFEMTFAPDAGHVDESEAVGGDRALDPNATIIASVEENRSGPVYKLRLSTMRDNFYYQFLYRVMANFVFVSFVPFSVILLLTIKIVCVVRESDRKRARFRKRTVSGDNRSGTASITSQPPTTSSNSYADVVLTLIAVKFLFFYSLPVIINIVELTVDGRTFEVQESDASRILKFLVDLANLLVVVDGATNSFFYFSWRNRLRTHRFLRNTKSNYAWLNLESRCTMNGEYSMGVISEGACTASRKRSPSTNELVPLRDLNLDKSWIPLRNVRME